MAGVSKINGSSKLSEMVHTRHVLWHMDTARYLVSISLKIKTIFVKSSDHDSNILTKNLSAELYKKHSRRWWVRSFKMLLASKIFEVKRKGVRDDVLTSNILFDIILMTRVSLT